MLYLLLQSLHCLQEYLRLGRLHVLSVVLHVSQSFEAGHSPNHHRPGRFLHHQRSSPICTQGDTLFRTSNFWKKVVVSVPERVKLPVTLNVRKSVISMATSIFFQFLQFRFNHINFGNCISEEKQPPTNLCAWRPSTALISCVSFWARWSR